MLELFVKFTSALNSALPALYKVYKNRKHEDKIIELLECYYILGFLIETADKLLSLSRSRDSIKFDELSKEELKQHYTLIQSMLTIQLQRLQRIGEIFLSNPTIELLDPIIQRSLKLAIGEKSRGLISLGAGLFFNCMFGAAKKIDENEDEHILRVVKEKYDFTESICNTSSISVVEQKNIVKELMSLREKYCELLNDLMDSKEKTTLSSKGKELAARYSIRK